MNSENMRYARVQLRYICISAFTWTYCLKVRNIIAGQLEIKPIHMALCLFTILNYMVWNESLLTLVTGLWWTVNVWNSCGPWPTVSGCCTITRTVPELVPYAISIQLPHKPDTNITSFHIQSTTDQCMIPRQIMVFYTMNVTTLMQLPKLKTTGEKKWFIVYSLSSFIQEMDNYNANFICTWLLQII